MAMGKRRSQQRQLWVETQELPKSPGHPFYQKLNAILSEEGFDSLAEERCQRFYADRMGRPSLAPGVYFRLLMIGYFEGIDSERGIAWRVSDSMALREFLGVGLTRNPPDHSTISRTRRLIDCECHAEVFTWVLEVLAKSGLVRGKTLGVDSTTLEANAAMRSIVRRDTGESYETFLGRLARASGIETPTREDLARVDRKREKKGSNDDWAHPHDPDARITKMKDGRTHLAHKLEQAVDMETGAVVALSVQPADRGDCQSIEHTVAEASQVFEGLLSNPEAAEKLAPAILEEIVADKGYHSNDVLVKLKKAGFRTCVSEPKRGRRKWKGKQEAQDAVYANRRRIRSKSGIALLRRRGEVLERPFAHALETGGLRRVFLRGRENIAKRALIHFAGLNLGLLMRTLHGMGTPRGLQGRLATLLALLHALMHRLLRSFRAEKSQQTGSSLRSRFWSESRPIGSGSWSVLREGTFTTGC